ncbi:MAG: hypothetical protein JWM27_2373 [Gemmatimonadetes bacterium]|nr:hypothetical protein [Gemmatimonadota bacterium]
MTAREDGIAGGASDAPRPTPNADVPEVPAAGPMLPPASNEAADVGSASPSASGGTGEPPPSADAVGSAVSPEIADSRASVDAAPTSDDPDAGAFWNTGPPEYVPGEPPPPPPTGDEQAALDAAKAAQRKGTRAALALFGVCALVGVMPAMMSTPLEGKLILLFAADVLMALVGPIVGIVVSLVLPKPSRSAFWTTGAICMLVTLLLWGVTCSLV